MECVQTDNGFEFTNRFSPSKRNLLTLFEATAAKLHIHHKLIQPYTQMHNGKVDTIQRLADKMMEELDNCLTSSGSAEKDLNAKLEDVKRKISKTWTLYYDNLMPKEDIAQRNENLTQQQKVIEKQIAAGNITARRPKLQRKNVIAYLCKCKKNLKSNYPDVLHSLIGTFVDKVTADPEKVKITIRIAPKGSADSDKVV